MDQVVLECSAGRDRSLDEREVGLLNRLRGELAAKVLERLRRSRDEDEPRGVGVDAMYRACEKGSVPKRNALGVARDDAVHQRSEL